MKTFEEFVRDIIPDIDKRYELYKLCQTPEKLIGLKVMSIRAGFSSLTGGTKMTINDVFYQDWGHTGNWVELIANEDTQLRDLTYSGWLCHIDELSHSVIPY